MMAALLPRQVRDAVARVPRYALAELPTPLEYLPRFTAALNGPRVFIKRDDLTGLAFGGNKARHNEFLLGDALDLKCDQFVWGAGIQSNNCRQTTAACARAGLPCHLVLTTTPAKPSGLTPPTVPHRVENVPAPPYQGNLLLDHLLGATIEFVAAGMGHDLDACIAAAADRFRGEGRRVYFWDRPRVTPRAALSYLLCAVEIEEQAQAMGLRPAAVYVSSAGATGAGVALGKELLGWSGPVCNIAPMTWPWDTRADLAECANVAADLLGHRTSLTRDDIEVNEAFIGPAYMQMSDDGLAALTLLARTEGVLLDPMYSAKAMAGLIADVKNGRWNRNDSVVFIHTGGTPVLFAVADELVRRTSSGVK